MAAQDALTPYIFWGKTSGASTESVPRSMAGFRFPTFCTLLLALAATALLSACAQRAKTATPAKEQRLAFSSVPDVEKASITTVLRVFEDEGKVGLCGCVLIVGQDQGVAILTERLHALDTRLLVGEQLAVSPAFLHEEIHTASQMGGKPVSFGLGQFPEKCTRVNTPWDPSLAAKRFKLSFTK